MPTGIPDPREALIRRAFQLQRVANSIARDNSGVLKELFDEVAALIAKIDPTAPSAVRYRRDRVAKLLKEVERLTDGAFSEWHKGVRSDLARMGRAHSEHVNADLLATLGPMSAKMHAAVLSQSMVKAILDRDPFQGETLKGWALKVNAPNTVKRIRQQVQMGMMEEESMGQIVDRVRGGHGQPGVWQATRDEADAVVRTAVTSVAADARRNLFDANKQIVAAVQFVASLDTRTCLACASLDGKTWDVGSPDIATPAIHFNCRCTLVSVIDWKGLGVPEPDHGQRLARNPRTGKWMQVSTAETYDQWLKSAPKSVQDEIMGPSRAKLFRSGKMRLDQLIGRDYHILTLDQLEGL